MCLHVNDQFNELFLLQLKILLKLGKFVRLKGSSTNLQACSAIWTLGSQKSAPKFGITTAFTMGKCVALFVLVKLLLRTTVLPHRVSWTIAYSVMRKMQDQCFPHLGVALAEDLVFSPRSLGLATASTVYLSMTLAPMKLVVVRFFSNNIYMINAALQFIL